MSFTDKHNPKFMSIVNARFAHSAAVSNFPSRKWSETYITTLILLISVTFEAIYELANIKQEQQHTLCIVKMHVRTSADKLAFVDKVTGSGPGCQTVTCSVCTIEVCRNFRFSCKTKFEIM